MELVDVNEKKQFRTIEKIAQHSRSQAFAALFELLDMEVDDCRNGLESARGDDVIRYQMAIIAYRGLKNRILNAESIVKAINADTPE